MQSKRAMISVIAVVVLLTVTVCLMILPGLKDVIEPKYSEQVLFQGDEDYYYRIPGIVVMDSGAVIAYCEKRAQGSSDYGDITVVYRTSKNGVDWDDEKVLIENPDGVTYNNPVMIADHQGRLHCIVCREYGIASRGGEVFYLRSDDEGLSFSEPVEISDFLLPDYHNAFATGPGHGICMENGMLLIPIWMVPKEYGAVEQAHIPSVAGTIFSKDGGTTWTVGELIEDISSPNEGTVVELSDGSVMLNLRNNDAQKRERMVAVSPNGITSWSGVHFDAQLPDPGCFGSLAKARRGDILYFINPASPTAREKITVRVSKDDGKTWGYQKLLISGGGYSDINTSSLWIYVLAERPGESKGLSTMSLTLQRFNQRWLYQQ